MPASFRRPNLDPNSGSGLCIWLTGLSGAGKTTTANALLPMLESAGKRVTSLDGDKVRERLSSELGFSKEDRDTNVKRIAFVASQIVYHEGIVICSLISPYRSTRAEARAMFPITKFMEVYVDTPLEVCEERDVKGHYLKARAGALMQFTGVSDSYEPPLNPELLLDTINASVEDNAKLVMSMALSKLAVNSGAVN